MLNEIAFPERDVLTALIGGSELERFQEFLWYPELLELHEELTALYPKSDFGMVSFTVWSTGQADALKQAATQDKLNQWAALDDQAREVHLVTADDKGESLSASDRKKRSNFEKLTAITENIREFRTKVEAHLDRDDEDSIPQAIIQQYLGYIDNLIAKCLAYQAIGTADFVRLQVSPQEFAVKADVKISKDRPKQLVFPWADQAKRILNSEQEKEKEITVGEGLAIYHISDEEFRSQGIDDVQEFKRKDTLTGDDSKKVALILIYRLNAKAQEEIFILKYEAERTTFRADPKSMELTVGGAREMKTASDYYVFGHELMHLLGYYRGSKSPIPLAQLALGCPGTSAMYEEGFTGALELALGLELGDNRMKKIAVRYLAISMATELEEDAEGNVVAKYSWQEIYDEMKQLTGDAGLAATTLRRIMRGTDFSRDPVQVQYYDAQKEAEVEVWMAPANIKDTLYLQGINELWGIIKKFIIHYLSDLTKEFKERVREGDLGFDNALLVALGQEVQKLLPLKVEDEKSQYARKFIFAILDWLRRGRMDLGIVLDEQHPLNQFMKREMIASNISLLDIFRLVEVNSSV